MSEEVNSLLFCPSSISSFGFIKLENRNNVKEDAEQKPSFIYGITKVYMELLGNYWTSHKGVDFRSYKYSGVASATIPHGGTTDFITCSFISNALCSNQR